MCVLFIKCVCVCVCTIILICICCHCTVLYRNEVGRVALGRERIILLAAAIILLQLDFIFIHEGAKSKSRLFPLLTILQQRMLFSCMAICVLETYYIKINLPLVANISRFPSGHKLDQFRLESIPKVCLSSGHTCINPEICDFSIKVTIILNCFTIFRVCVGV